MNPSTLSGKSQFGGYVHIISNRATYTRDPRSAELYSGRTMIGIGKPSDPETVNQSPPHLERSSKGGRNVEREHNECERYILKVLDEHKYFVYPMLLDGGFTYSELFAGIKRLSTDKTIISISVPYKQKGRDATMMLYSTLEYASTEEPLKFLREKGVSLSAAKGYLAKMRNNAMYSNPSYAVRTARKKQTLRDIDYKAQIVANLNREGPKSLFEITDILGLETAHVKALLSSLSVAKAIRYDAPTKTYISLTTKY